MTGTSALAADELQVLFLGDNGPHRPRERFAILEPVMRDRGIQLTYTDRVADLNPEQLAQYDALLLYANIDRIEKAEAKALLDYVAEGGGFVPLHCASFCFRNSEPLVKLIGAQFQRHGWARMRETVASTDHPITKDYGGFESLDETYEHHLHNEKDRTVLSYRVEGDKREPWTWVRKHGDGRVFYTAWGHDHHTWRHPGFHNLVERGIRWAAGKDPADAGAYVSQATFIAPAMTKLPPGPTPFEYVDVGAKIPNYVAGAQWGTQAEPLRQMQKPLSPEESMRRIVVPEGFRVELFAAEPELGGKPICMAWDERGRLWVAETLDYPNELQPENRGRDRIRICEDSDGDGRADKFTLFAEGLSIPTSIAFARGGVIVHNGTETLFLKDTDGDDRADERSVLLARWAMGDTHGGPSNMQYGLDNWIWGMQGYNSSRIRIGDETTPFAQGFHRFRPDGSAIEFLRSTNNNTWGLGISEEGIVFGSTANRNPSNYMPIPNRYYERVRGWSPRLTLQMIADTHLFRPITDKVRQVDHHGGYTAGAGHALYTARAYPQQYWNRTAFVCGPTGHLVGIFTLSADGADFHSTNPANLLASDDEWVAPIMAEVGPDGFVWVIDWYNYIVQHNPTPEGFETGRGNAYESDLRDKRHGRIYRIVYDAAEPAPRLDLSQAGPDELVATLANDNLYWRRHAQRLLVERGELDVLPQLLKLVRDEAVDAIGLNVGAIHALWTLHGLGALDGEHPEATAVAVGALRHASAGVRRNAVQVLPHTDESTEAILQVNLLRDSDAQVRLHALLALADMPPSAAAGQAVAKFLVRDENAADRWLVDAATSAGAMHALDFLLAVAASDEPTRAHRDVGEIVANHFARSDPGESLERVLRALASADARLAGAIVTGLEQGTRREASIAHPDAVRDVVDQLHERFNLTEQIALARLAIRIGIPEMESRLESLCEELFARVENEELEIRERVRAAELIVAAQPEEISVTERLLDSATPQAPPELSAALIRALGESTAPELGAVVVERTSALTPSSREAAIDLLLGRPQLTDDLLDAIDEGAIRASDLSLLQKQRLNDYPSRRLRARARDVLAKVQQSISADREQVLAQFADLANSDGVASRGKAVFTKHCATCHSYQGEGATIGPDLSGMAVHGKDELLRHILDPSRDVEGNYQAYVVMLQEGRVLNGMLAGESATSIELVDAQAKRITILREEIDELARSGASFMPEGFENQLSRSELGDLLEFLTQRTRFVPLDLRRAATTSTAASFFRRPPGSPNDTLFFSDWGMKTFAGVPFFPIDPQDGRVENAIVLFGNRGRGPSRVPRSFVLQCGMPASAVHFLSGVSFRGFPATEAGSEAMIVRLHYADGTSEDHPLVNGEHFADLRGDADVSGSQRAFTFGRGQLRYFKIVPARGEAIGSVELIKGEDRTAPIVMAITVEQR